MTAGIDITTGQRKTLLALLRRYIPGVEVWAYGSRVRWNARPNSDLDLVAFTTPAQRQQVSELKEALGESNIPFPVDLHVWDDVPERFHAIIRKEYVVLQKAEKGNSELMAGGWRNVALQEVFEINPRREINRGTIAPYVPMDALLGHTREIARLDFREYTGSGTRFMNRDTLLARITPCLENGKTAYISGLEENIIAHGSTEYIVIAEKQNVSNGLFAYYLSRSSEFRTYAIGHMKDTSGRQRVPSEAVAKFRFNLPPLPEQKAIAHILGTLDDKIELNQRMNATLEAMARALFQSWFVDFDPVRRNADRTDDSGLTRRRGERGVKASQDLPPLRASAPPRDPNDALFTNHFQETDGAKIPVGWKYISVEKLCSINAWTLNKNDALNTLEYVEISEVNRGNINNIATYQRGEEPSRARRRLRHGDTVLSTVRPDRGSYFLALNPPNNRVASTRFAVLTPTKAPWAFIHTALTQPDFSEHIGQFADGGAYPAVRPEIIGAWKVVVPDRMEILETFQNVCEPLFTQAEANREQSRTLAALRDTLLPKLLSGELSVANAEIHAETRSARREKS